MNDTASLALNNEQKRHSCSGSRRQGRSIRRGRSICRRAGGAGGLRRRRATCSRGRRRTCIPIACRRVLGEGRSALAAALAASHEPRYKCRAGRQDGARVVRRPRDWQLLARRRNARHDERSGSRRVRTWRSSSCRIPVRGARFRRSIVSEHVRARLKGTAPIAIADVTVPATGGLLGSAALRRGVVDRDDRGAGTFIFGLVMALQGLALQILPRRLFLRASSFLQLGAFAVIVSVYCLQSSAGLRPRWSRRSCR